MIGYPSFCRSVPACGRWLLFVVAFALGVRAESPAVSTPDSARDRIAELRAAVARADMRYFQQAAPELSDAAYDALKRELAALEQRFPVEAAAVAPLPAVGDDREAGFAKATHRVPLLSLDKVYTEAELRAWYAQMAATLGEPAPACVVEPKIDGLAISVVYEKGQLVRAVTRGNGHEGDDVTVNARALRSLPATLRVSGAEGAPPVPDLIELRGEVYLSRAEFARLNREREDAGEVPFAHPRNVAAGTLKAHDPREVSARRLDVVFYGWGACEPATLGPRSQQAFHAQARAWGLPTLERVWPATGADAVWAAVRAVEQARDELAAPLDGAVLKLDDVARRDALGATAQAPRWAVAYKYTPARATTPLRRIVVQVGRTGVLTPVAEFAPVVLGGSTVARATLYNRDYLARLDLRVGDGVVVEKAGEVVPAIVGVNRSTRSAASAAFEFPAICPACATPVVAVAGCAAVRCPNRDGCPAQLARRIEYFCGQSGVGIEGVGAALAETLVATGRVRSVADLYRLRPAELVALPGVGEATAAQLCAQIERSRRAELWRFINGLGIPLVGPAKAKLLARHYGGLAPLAAATADNLPPALGEATGQSVRAFFAQPAPRALVAELLAAGVRPTPPPAASARLAGKSFVLTGRLPTLSREAATRLIEAAGGVVRPRVTPQTGYVLAGEAPGEKLARARALGVPVIDEATLRQMLAEE